MDRFSKDNWLGDTKNNHKLVEENRFFYTLCVELILRKDTCEFYVC